MPEDLAIIFAYHFPPENVIGALRPFRFYKYLSELGYRCHVITAADVTQVAQIDGQYVPDPFVVNPRQGSGWQVERAVRRFLLPGVTGSQWALQAYRAARRYLAANPQYRVTIFSTFPPVGTHMAAYWLARRTGLPWIADFRDPLADNQVYNHIPKYTKEMYRKVEKIFVRSAEYVIANTDAAQQKLKRSYPDRADRIVLIWNGFDPEDRLVPLPVAAGRRVVAHVGELYGGRSASPLLHSLRRLIDRKELSADRFQVHLAGPVVEGSIPGAAFMSTACQQGCVRLDTARVPQNEAHRIVRTAGSLLLIQPQSAVQVPGKLFEYLQMGRPILALVPRDSAVERILARSGVPYRCIYAEDAQQEFDRAVLDFFQSEPVERPPNSWFENEFNVRDHARKVADLIQLANRDRVKPAILTKIPQD